MPSFSLTPLTDVPPPEQQDFPNFLQWQENGTDLGLPDADTVNCSTGITATRGVGENSNVITLTAEGGAATVSMLTLNNPPDPPVEEIMLFDGSAFLAFWVFITNIASADWEWIDNSADDPPDSYLHIITAGVYRLTCTCFIEAETEWPDGDTTYGSTVDGVSTSAQARHHNTGDLVDTRTRMQWTDQHFISADADTTWRIGLFAQATETTHVVLFSGLQIIIERIADYP